MLHTKLKWLRARTRWIWWTAIFLGIWKGPVWLPAVAAGLLFATSKSFIADIEKIETESA